MWIWPPGSTRHRLPDSGRAGVPLPTPQPVRVLSGSFVRALSRHRGKRFLAGTSLSILIVFGLGGPGAFASNRPQEGHAVLGAGWQALERGQFQEAARLFENATLGNPTDAMAWVGLALSARGLQQDAGALRSLTNAIQHDPSFTEAHRLLGRLYLDLDQPDLAIGHYEVALRQDPNDIHIRSELRQARHFLQDEGRLSRIGTAHFVVKFDEGLGREQAARVATYLEEVCEAMREAFTYVPATPLIAIVHAQDRRPVPEWVEGLFDGRIHVSTTHLEMPRPRLGAYLRHEYTHAVIHRLSQGRAPTWLDEGLAQYLERRVATKAAVRESKDEGGPILLESLQGDFAGMPRSEAARKYADSLRATSVMVRQHGLDGLKRWLETLAVSKDLAQAYERVFDRPYPTVIAP